MDKIIEKKTGWRVAFTKKALPWWLGALLAAFIIYLIARPNNKTLRVDKDTITVSTAVKGEFNDYIRISGRVQPMTTIQLSPQEGGIVEQILIEEGSRVKAGDPILLLNNDNLDLQILNSEAELAEKENILRNTQIQMEQQKLDVRQNVLEYGTQVDRLKRAYEQQKALYEDKLIAKEDYLKAEEDYRLALQKYDLIRERSKQDSLYRGTQIDRMEESLENMQLNMQMIPGAHRRGTGASGCRPGTEHRIRHQDRPDKLRWNLQSGSPDRRTLHRPRRGRPGGHLRASGRDLFHRYPQSVSGGA